VIVNKIKYAYKIFKVNQKVFKREELMIVNQIQIVKLMYLYYLRFDLINNHFENREIMKVWFLKINN
jgi:hypothetical protein